VKTIRRIKILLTTKEFLAVGFGHEKTNAETNMPVCPVCHSPLPAPEAPGKAGKSAESKLEKSETKNIKNR